jgi:DNA-binding MarR family transcriptional regulator
VSGYAHLKAQFVRFLDSLEKAGYINRFEDADKVVEYTTNYDALLKKVAVEGEDSAEVESGYCLDCKHYIFGGFCGKTNRHTGALNEKQCFKRNKS